ncbi:MAG: class I SAM-dependent methyltransferase [Marinicaulis sp.]|nr:SAM-dependent methyltransferase [Marinicaulis sp.]NNL87690.1 class I SAM-dependent methyltransferase [Marinicaulis sp.]
MTTKTDAAEPTPLQERLVQLIKLKGPITVADYMSDALGHPHDGYYMSNNAIGADGDFITAPEISQVFGELIGLWLVDAWRAMGSPSDFNLIELGPGRGVLMDDILRAARLRPAFTGAAKLWLLETSGRLRHEQQRRLRTSEVNPNWVDEFADIPPAPSLIIANEFFDCMPVRQFQRIETGWRERLVGVGDDGKSLEFVLGKTPPPKSFGLPEIDDTKPGDIFELSFEGRDLAMQLAEFLRTNGGQALVIDYGHMQSGLGDTLQAVRGHKFWPPLAAPGSADITAHVDFEKLAQTAFDCGAVVYGPVSQGTFLERLGLNLRVEMLCKTQDKKKADEIRAGAYRIAAPDQMGEIFKVMAITAPGLDEPAGFEET